MPRIFSIGSYSVYFWSNENEPLEPIHVHVTKGKAKADGTKIWIYKSGEAHVSNKGWKNDIELSDRKNIIKMIEINKDLIIENWYNHFDKITYYC